MLPSDEALSEMLEPTENGLRSQQIGPDGPPPVSTYLGHVVSRVYGTDGRLEREGERPRKRDARPWVGAVPDDHYLSADEKRLRAIEARLAELEARP
jgi:hypothetical protein